MRRSLFFRWVARCLVSPLLVLGIWFLPALVCADDTHYENLRFGQTAIGFGGAVTGFLVEPEAAYYNPGGLGFLEKAKFSGAMNFLGKDERIIRRFLSFDELGFPERDGVSKGFLSLPTSSVVVQTFYGGKHAVAFSTFLQSEIQEAFAASVDVSGLSERLTLSERFNDTVVFIGPSYALRWSEDVGVGVSVFYARRETSQQDLFAIRSLKEDEGVPAGYEEVQESVDIKDGAMLAKVGVMWRPAPLWSVGAVISTAALRLHGAGGHSSRLIDALNEDSNLEQFIEFSQRSRARSQYPWSLGLGAAYGKENDWRVAGALNVYMPLNYTRMQLEETPTKNGIFSSFTPLIDKELTVNASLGGEYYVDKHWPLRAGIFTNHASSPEFIRRRLSSPRLPHVDLYGLTFSLGYQGAESSVNFGVEFQGGSGHETTLNAELDFESETPFSTRERERTSVLFFISGALTFVGKKASDIIEPKDKKKRKKKRRPR